MDFSTLFLVDLVFINEMIGVCPDERFELVRLRNLFVFELNHNTSHVVHAFLHVVLPLRTEQHHELLDDGVHASPSLEFVYEIVGQGVIADAIPNPVARNDDHVGVFIDVLLLHIRGAHHQLFIPRILSVFLLLKVADCARTSQFAVDPIELNHSICI